MSKTHSHNFIRFGGLSKMDQKTYGNDTFHSPPRKKGIYAFPEGLVDKFLLGATNDPRNLSHKSYWLRDENGNRINSVNFYNLKNWIEKLSSFEINKKYKSLIKKSKIKIKDIFEKEDYKIGQSPKWFIAVYKKPRFFKYSGEIWCHLGEQLQPEHIIEESGSWVKVTMEDYLYAIRKEKHDLKKFKIQVFGMKYKDTNPYKNISTDHLEVFIEKIN